MQRPYTISPDLLPANCREIQKAVPKCLKRKQLLERETLNVEYLWKSSYLFTSDFISPYLVLSLYF